MTSPPFPLTCPTCFASVEANAETCPKCGSSLSADSGNAEATALLGELSRALEGRYKIGEGLGAGRGGITTLATHLASNRQLAIKVAWKEPRARTQVLRETVLMGKVSHPRVLPVKDVHAPESMLVIEMQLATGGTVEDLLVAGTPVPSNVYWKSFVASRGHSMKRTPLGSFMAAFGP